MLILDEHSETAAGDNGAYGSPREHDRIERGGAEQRRQILGAHQLTARTHSPSLSLRFARCSRRQPGQTDTSKPFRQHVVVLEFITLDI